MLFLFVCLFVLDGIRQVHKRRLYQQLKQAILRIRWRAAEGYKLWSTATSYCCVIFQSP